MKVFVTTGDWKIKEPTEQETINALSTDNQINDPTPTETNNKTVTEIAQCPRVHRKGEPVCAYLRYYAKDPLWGQKQGVVPTELWSRIVEVYPQVIERYAPLKKTLKRASGSPFRSVGKREGR